MTIEELKQQLDNLKKLKDKQKNDEDKESIQIQIDAIEEQIRQKQHEENSRTTGQRVGGFVGRVISGAAAMVVGEVDACITGRTDEKSVKKDRARIIASGEKVGSSIGGFLERGIRSINDHRRR